MFAFIGGYMAGKKCKVKSDKKMTAKHKAEMKKHKKMKGK